MKKKKKKQKKSKKGEVDRGDGIFCSLKENDVPADPPNYFLARRIPSPDKEKERSDDREKRERSRERSPEKRRERRTKTDDSGRVIRGTSLKYSSRAQNSISRTWWCKKRQRRDSSALASHRPNLNEGLQRSRTST